MPDPSGTSEHVEFYIREYKLALQNGRLCSRLHQQDLDLEGLPLPTREAIVEELCRRVVPFALWNGTAPGQRDLDPWRHALPGVERMEEAKELLARWMRNSFPIRVCSGAPITASDTFNALTLTVPAYLKMEMLWLLMQEREKRLRGLAVGLRWAGDCPGGVA